MTTATIIDGFIPLSAGIYTLLIATDKMPFPGNLKMQNWAKDKKKLFLILGPLLIIFGVLQMMGALSV